MGRVRARLAKSEVDREVQEQVAIALQAVERALRICRQARRGHSVESRRALRVARDLARARSALGGVGRLTPLYDVDDPDLMPDRRTQRREEPQPPSEEEVPELDEGPEPEPEAQPGGD